MTNGKKRKKETKGDGRNIRGKMGTEGERGQGKVNLTRTQISESREKKEREKASSRRSVKVIVRKRGFKTEKIQEEKKATNNQHRGTTEKKNRKRGVKKREADGRESQQKSYKEANKSPSREVF